jgi:PAS domain S-box-containing protein/putative nucleotidyltransferase with HDIG domain
MLSEQRGMSHAMAQAMHAGCIDEEVFGADLLKGRIGVIQIPVSPRESLLRLAWEEGFQTVVAVPLMARERATGVLMIASRTPRTDFSREVPFLEEIGRQIAQAVENIRLFERVARSKEEWERTFDAIRDPVFVHDPEHRIIVANRAYEEMAGRPFQEIVGRPYYELFPVKAAPLALCHEGSEARDELEEVDPRTGRIFRHHSYPIRGEQGQLLSGVHLIEDVTDIRRAEAEILASEERHRELVLTAPDAIIGGDETGRVMLWNPAAERMFGYQEAEILGQSLTHLMPEPYREAHWQGLSRFLETGEGRIIGKAVEVEGLRKDGTIFPLEIILSAQTLNGGRYRFTGFLRDITERKQAEERIRQEMETSKALLEMANVLSRSLDRTGLLSEVPSFLERLLGAERCACYLWEEALEAFVPVQIHGFPGHLVPLVRASRLRREDLAALGVLGGKPPVVVLKDLAAILPQIRELPDSPEPGPALVISLLSGDRFIGFLLVGYRQPRRLTERETALAKGIADQLALYLVNAELYREASERAMQLAHRMETLEVMHEIDRSILSTLDRGEILETAALLLGRLIPCDRCTVVQVDREAGGFRYVAGWGTDNVVPKGAFVPFEETNATEVITTRRPVSRPDLSSAKGLLPLDRKFFEAGFRSDLRLPIIVHGEVAALLNLGSRHPGAFLPDHLATAEKVVGQIGVALENARLIEDLEGLFLGTVKTLSAAIDAKSPWTKGHSERVTEYALLIGREMGLSEADLKSLRLAGLLHDIGKIGTYEALLDKPDRLSPEEYELVKVHPAKGAEILAPIKQLKHVIPGVQSHHERWDGAGYPDGLAGENIPPFGRILAVADTYDSITADRPYRRSPGHAWALEEIQRCSGSQFDPRVAEAFLRALEKKP